MRIKNKTGLEWLTLPFLLKSNASVFGKHNGDHFRHSKRVPPRVTFILNSPPSFSSAGFP